MHRILLEDGHQPSVEAQRRLNPTMKEVFLKEVLKWLDVRVIYPISDSAWVSSVQVVAKNGGTTVIKADNNILLPSRIVQEGIVLGHLISARGIEVDKAKIEAIEKLPPPSSIKGIRIFLRHARFYKRFIKDFSRIAKPLSSLLVQGAPFDFDEECVQAFTILKGKLVSAPIVVAPD